MSTKTSVTGNNFLLHKALGCPVEPLGYITVPMGISSVTTPGNC